MKQLRWWRKKRAAAMPAVAGVRLCGLQVEMVVVCKWLWWRCVQKGAATIEGRRGNGGHGYCRVCAAFVRQHLCGKRSMMVMSNTDSIGCRRWLLAEKSLLAVTEDGSERLLLVMIKSLLVAIKVDGIERSLLVGFVWQEIVAGCVMQ
ncbi:hypothetical protein GW17_00054264 [Ensete ventricosum]|nr:hypothetical protein GW17_00054264 [Ensete ventricosum]